MGFCFLEGVMARTFTATVLFLVASAAIAGDDSPIQSALRAAGLSAAELVRASSAALSNRDGSAVAVSVPRQQRSLVLVLLRQASGEYYTVDVSAVEDGNFGKLGFPRSRYDRYETQPVEWRARDDGLFQVVMRTQAWQGRQRFTVSEPLLLQPSGTPLWR
jgi:hypothetical protein